MLADPTAADLAARVAIGGPVVGIGLVAVIESVGPDTVAARRDLLLALGETNAFLFDQRQLQLWRALRDGDALRKGCGLWAVEDVVRAHAPPGHVRLAGPQLGTILERCRPSGAQVISQTPAVACSRLTRRPGRNRPALR